MNAIDRMFGWLKDYRQDADGKIVALREAGNCPATHKLAHVWSDDETKCTRCGMAQIAVNRGES